LNAPTEFEDLLTREGKRVLAGTHALVGALADPRTRFLSIEGLIDRTKAARLRTLLDRTLPPVLERIDRSISPDTIWKMREDYAEALPKATRASTIYFDRANEAGVQVARRIGLDALLRSASFHAFAQALAGRALAPKFGQQVLCYGPGDYAGPHNDHHPGNAKARKGYIDLHLSLSSPAVAHQWLVYAKAGHLSEIVPVHGAATLTAYRLPFWHYTTPLVAKPGREAKARRWVLLGTFLFV
jgi:hypothetical protein